MRRLVIVLLVLVLAGAGILGYGFYQKDILEKAAMRVVADIPGTLRAERAEAVWFKDKVTVYGLEGVVAYVPEAPFFLKVESLTVEDTKSDVTNSAKAQRIAAMADFRGLRIQPVDETQTPASPAVTLDTFTVANVFVDTKAFAETGRKGLYSTDFVKALLSLSWEKSEGTNLRLHIENSLEALETPFDDLQIPEEQRNGQIVVTSLGTDAFSLSQWEGLHLDGILVKNPKGDLVTTESIRFDSFSVFPEMLRLFMEKALEVGNPNDFSTAPLLLVTEGFTLKGSIAGFAIPFPNNADVVFSVDAFAFNTTLGGLKAQIETSTNGVNIPRELVALVVPEDELGSVFRERDYVFSSRESIEVAVSSLSTIKVAAMYSEPSLGKVEGDFEGSIDMVVKDRAGEPSKYLKNGHLAFTDTGLMEAVYKAAAMRKSEDGLTLTPEQVKNLLIAEMRNESSRTPLLDGMQEKVIDFMEHSGTIGVSIEPEQPIAFTSAPNEFAALVAPYLEVFHTPAGK